MMWWRVNEHGCAVPYPDTQDIRNRVDRECGWYGTVEGCILHGGVIATAFHRKTSQTFDAARWLATGERVAMGSVTITEITASPDATGKRWSIYRNE